MVVLELDPGLMSVFVSVLLEGAAGSFTIVVLFSVFFSAGGLVTVVSFCSHAPNRATLASKQIYFFISSCDVLVMTLFAITG